jgi:nitroreductase
MEGEVLREELLIPEQASWQVVRETIRRRRSNLQIDPDRPIPQELIDMLLELACWAPNHKLTHPWRFAVLSGTARERFGNLAADAQQQRGVAPGKVEKTRVKYCRAPVVLVVGSAAHNDPVVRRENRDAVAAGVENILLGATSLGLASYWATGDVVDEAAVKAYVDFDPSDEIVAVVYLGWPTAECPPHLPETPRITVIDR